MTDENQDDIPGKLARLRIAHRTLDEEIARMFEERPFQELEVKRLKKRKLALKDLISSLENSLIPDIIA